jgi:hypothetical protein
MLLAPQVLRASAEVRLPLEPRQAALQLEPPRSDAERAAQLSAHSQMAAEPESLSAPSLLEAQPLLDGSRQPAVQPRVFLLRPGVLAHAPRVAAQDAARPAVQPPPCAA